MSQDDFDGFAANVLFSSVASALFLEQYPWYWRATGGAYGACSADTELLPGMSAIIL